MENITCPQPLINHHLKLLQRQQPNGANVGGGISRAIRHFSAISRATHRHKMPIRRLTPSHPPAISAEVLQFVQQMQ